MNNDLISREAVIDRYYAEWEKQDICDGSEDRNWLMQCIDEAPAVDAVEAVYAEDYKHSFEMIAEKYAKIQDEMLKGELVEVVHGRWKQCFEDWRKQIEGDKCSACGFEHYGTSIRNYNYCPNCGARMDGE